MKDRVELNNLHDKASKLLVQCVSGGQFGVAQMLSQQNDAPSGAEAAEEAAPSGAPDLASLSSLLGGIDMATVSRFLPLLQEMNSGRNDERTQLLYALKPFLKPERQEKIDTALRLARLLRAGKVFFKGFGGA